MSPRPPAEADAAKATGLDATHTVVRMTARSRSNAPTMARRPSIPAVIAALAILLAASGIWLRSWPDGSRGRRAPFMAEAVLRIVPGAADREGRSEADRDAFRSSQFQLLRSPVVLDAALRRPGIADLETVREQEDPSGWLSETIDASVVDDPEMFVIRLRGTRPEDLRRILAAVTEAYLDDIVNPRRQDILARRASLEEGYTCTSRDLREKKAAHEKLAGTERRSKADQDDLDALREEIATLQSLFDRMTRQLRESTNDLAEAPVAALVGEVTVRKAE